MLAAHLLVPTLTTIPAQLQPRLRLRSYPDAATLRRGSARLLAPPWTRFYCARSYSPLTTPRSKTISPINVLISFLTTGPSADEITIRQRHFYFLVPMTNMTITAQFHPRTGSASQPRLRQTSSWLHLGSSLHQGSVLSRFVNIHAPPAPPLQNALATLKAVFPLRCWLRDEMFQYSNNPNCL